MIKTLEEHIEGGGTATILAQHAQVYAAHHRSHHYIERDDTAYEHSHEGDAEKQPVLVLDDIPSGFEALDGFYGSGAKFYIVGTHGYVSFIQGSSVVCADDVG
jgi:hypothetical protein